MLDELLQAKDPQSNLPIQLSCEFPSLGCDIVAVDSRKVMSEILFQQSSGEKDLYNTVKDEWLQPESNNLKSSIAIAGPAQVGKTQLLKSLLRDVRRRYDYLFYVPLMYVNFSTEMNILQFLALQNNLKWFNYQSDSDFQLFKRVVEKLQNSKEKVCIILDDLDKSEYNYKKHVYDKAIFETTEAGFLVTNILRKWFRNGQKIVLLRPWEFFQLHVDNALQSMNTIYVQGIDHERLSEDMKIRCQWKSCRSNNACLGSVITNHNASECSLCKHCCMNNCHKEIQSLSNMPNLRNLLIKQLFLTPSSAVVAVASVLTHDLYRKIRSFLKNFSLNNIGRFAWENYAQRYFVFEEGDFLASDLKREEINLFFSCMVESSLFSSEDCNDLVFFFSHILLQELLAALWLLTLPSPDFKVELNVHKKSFLDGSFDVLRDFMLAICTNPLLKKYHKTLFKEVQLENLQYLRQSLMAKQTSKNNVCFRDT